jgi:amino acid adenylation domain-containing protein
VKDLEAFLSELRELGVKLWVDGDKLKFRAPDGVLHPGLTDGLRARKPEILALLRPQPVEPIPPLPAQEHYALSAAQRRLWVLAQMPGACAAYNIPLHQSLEGPLDRTVLEAAFARLVERHESLRTTFVSIEGEPRQVVHPRMRVPIEFRDLRGTADAEEVVRQLGQDAARTPFDLAKGPLLRVVLLKLAEQRHVLLFTISHIIADGLSLAVLARDLSRLYRSIRRGETDGLPRLGIGYAAYASWQNRLFDSEVMVVHRRYWRDMLAGELPILDLPTDHPRPPIQSFRGRELSFALPAEQLEALQAFCNSRNATLFMLLHAILKVLLHAYTGQEDIIIGCPVAGREHPDLADQIGFYLNVLPLRSRLRPQATFEEFLREIVQATRQSFDHQVYPFDQLVGELNVARDLSRSPLFDVMLILQNQEESGLDFDGIEACPIFEHPGTSKCDLTFCFKALPHGLILAIEYDSDLFRTERIERMGRHFMGLAASVLANPRETVGRLNLLTAAERRQLLDHFNRTASPYPRDRTVVELFDAAVARTPEAVAAVCGGDCLTFGELQARADRLARFLLARGVQPMGAVGLCVGRSLEMLVGLLGILKAGAAYVPLDPTFPPDRLAYIVKNAGADWVVTRAQTRDHLPHRGDNRIDLDADRDEIARCPERGPLPSLDPRSLAYVIYTSGSTGRPKGIEISHGSLVNLLLAMARAPGLLQHDVLLAVTTVSFDIAALELYLPLIENARLVLAGDADVVDGVRLMGLMRDCGASVMQATPATWRLLLAAGWQGNPGLKILCGGEALPGSLAEQLLARAGSVWNMYGPTETTVWSTCRQLDRHDKAPRDAVESIGRPIANTEIYILDPQMRPVPIGVPGELHIGGDGLAAGYRNLAQLSAEKFIRDPFSDDAERRLYKTGDLARYRESGDIEYLGRVDQEVKVRGFRIDLGEIEAVLASHPEIRQAVVDARDDTDGDRRVVGWYVSIHGRELPPAALRDHLRRKLPDFMIPASFVGVPALPLIPNGKVDRNALTEPMRDRAPLGYATPRTEWEHTLVRLWKQVLKVPKVGIHDNFFELGGHSLKATDFIARLHKETGVQLNLVDIFRNPTVSSLAVHSAMSDGAGRLFPGTAALAPARIPAVDFTAGETDAILPPSAEELELLKRP